MARHDPQEPGTPPEPDPAEPAGSGPDRGSAPDRGSEADRGSGPDRGSGADSGSAPAGAEQALRALEQRLGRASEAAERLIAEAAGAAARTVAGAGETDDRDTQPPPSGWAAPGSESDSDSSRGLREGELDTLMRFVGSLRDLVPPELQRRVAEAVRELLLAVRALIDWYLERAEQRRRSPTAVEDIPIL
jgi:hypothetical protein